MYHSLNPASYTHNSDEDVSFPSQIPTELSLIHTSVKFNECAFTANTITRYNTENCYKPCHQRMKRSVTRAGPTIDSESQKAKLEA